jgi:hypothetical protein
MVDVRPDEISAILREQISGFDSKAKLVLPVFMVYPMYRQVNW